MTYVDTLGVDDISGRNTGVEYVLSAIHSASKLKIVFIVEAESGRIRTPDLVQIKIVLDGFRNAKVDIEEKVSLILTKSSKRQFQIEVLNQNILNQYKTLSKFEHILVLLKESTSDR